MKESSLDITTFKRIEQEMVAKSDAAWDSWYSSRYVHQLHDYSPEEIEKIVNGTDVICQQRLSRNYYNKSGFYKRIILYYATLLKYMGILIPHPSIGKQLSNPYISKRYYAGLEYIDKINIVDLFTRISVKVLVDGSFFGLIQNLDKNNLVIFDLPSEYSRSRFRDIYGNDIIEFDVSYFNTILDEYSRQSALNAYPTFISNYYKKWLKGKASTSWLTIPVDMGVCFSFFDNYRPLFLNVIPATIQYDEAVDTERERDLEEIRKIIVQKIPHLADGQLLFEPEEALEMHRGAVDQMKKNKNLFVLTTYADVDAIVSKTTAENVSSSLDKMLQNIYSEASVSAQIFSPTNIQALNLSIKNDLSLMMVLANKYAHFITYVINKLFSNSNIEFCFKFLPVSYYNDSEYITDTFKLAQSGYSFLVPAIASGITQHELTSLKELENDVLRLHEILLPLQSAYTQSGNEVGAPEKKLEDKAEKTIKNEEAIGNQGDSE